MEFAAYLDAHTVEMRILTETGQSIAIVCPRDSIFAIQKHIGQMRDECPEIATWSEDYRVQRGTLARSPSRRGAALEHQPTDRSTTCAIPSR
jgi:hypothetical protein